MLNVKTFNEQLKTCKCGTTVSDNKVDITARLAAESLAKIKNHYLTNRFLEKLNSCKD